MMPNRTQLGAEDPRGIEPSGVLRRPPARRVFLSPARRPQQSSRGTPIGCDNTLNSGYNRHMTEALSRRLKQARFATPQQEAVLSLAVAASTLNDLVDEVCKRHGLTRPQYNVLRILRGVHPEGHPRCEIALRMVERAPDITRLVDRLQARGPIKGDVK